MKLLENSLFIFDKTYRYLREYEKLFSSSTVDRNSHIYYLLNLICRLEICRLC